MMKRFRVIALLFAFALSGCAEAELAAHVAKSFPGVSPPKSQGSFKVGKPYKVMGKWYTPEESYTLVETGIASWYGPNFHGKLTANGETFDMYELTAAHRTLQMPSLVRVTNLENGRSLVVRVNDRGPFKRGRIIDLSKRTAELLKFKNQGTAKVRVEVLERESMAIAEAAKRGEDVRGVEVAMNEKIRAPLEPRPRTIPAQAPDKTYVDTKTPESLQRVSTARAPAGRVESVPGHDVGGRFYPDPVVKTVPVSPSSIYVQAGSFGNVANANRLAQTLKRFGDAQVVPAMVDGRQFYRVRILSNTVDQADILLDRMAKAGMNDAMIVVD